MADRMENPFEFVEQVMAAFNDGLAADPGQSLEAVTERKVAELLEEVA